MIYELDMCWSFTYTHTRRWKVKGEQPLKVSTDMSVYFIEICWSKHENTLHLDVCGESPHPPSSKLLCFCVLMHLLPLFLFFFFYNQAIFFCISSSLWCLERTWLSTSVTPCHSLSFIWVWNATALRPPDNLFSYSYFLLPLQSSHYLKYFDQITLLILTQH